MFCSNCGKEILDNQKFCCYCGSENVNLSQNQIVSSQPVSVASTSARDNQSGFNRDVLINYLNNIQTLEFAKNKLETNKDITQDNIYSLANPQNIRPPIVDWGEHGSVIGFILFFFVVALGVKWLLSSIDLFGGLQGLAVLVMGLAVVALILYVIYSIKEHADGVKAYETNIANEKARMISEEKQKQKLISLIPKIDADIERTANLLNDAYSINIIPAKYRNIYGAYFLFEYISTSSVSLSEALYHCDLDEISRKLDVIIDQQREMIMELARSNALNEQIVRQNEETLKHAIAAEKNTAMAAQYAEIASINTRTVAQVQSYYFFKNGL